MFWNLELIALPIRCTDQEPGVLGNRVYWFNGVHWFIDIINYSWYWYFVLFWQFLAL